MQKGVTVIVLSVVGSAPLIENYRTLYREDADLSVFLSNPSAAQHDHAHHEA
jgi:hypothetical protein